MAAASHGDPAQGEARTLEQLLSQTLRRVSPADAWSPNVNVYQSGHRLEVCVDLAGVRRDQLDVRVEPGRLSIRGHREPPDPTEQEGAVRIVAMEIDSGPFCRTVQLPSTVALNEVTSSYDNGLLWIVLPLKTAAGGARYAG